MIFDNAIFFYFSSDENVRGCLHHGLYAILQDFNIYCFHLSFLFSSGKTIVSGNRLIVIAVSVTAAICTLLLLSVVLYCIYRQRRLPPKNYIEGEFNLDSYF